MAAALKVADRIVSRWAAGDDPPSSVWIELASILEARADDVEVREVERCRRLASVAKAAAQLEDIEDPKELNKLFRSNDTPGWQMRVAGLVSRIFPNGARVAVPMGTYEMRELSIDRYELTRREGPTFTLSTLEVSTYVGSGAWFRSAAGGCKAAKCRDRSNRWGGLPPSSPCTLNCCYCGGTTPTETIDHVPSAQMFDRKLGLEGWRSPPAGAATLLRAITSRWRPC